MFLCFSSCVFVFQKLFFVFQKLFFVCQKLFFVCQKLFLFVKSCFFFFFSKVVFFKCCVFFFFLDSTQLIGSASACEHERVTKKYNQTLSERLDCCPKNGPSHPKYC